LVLTLLSARRADLHRLIGAAIAVTLRRGGLLLAVIVLPLTVPVLIFASPRRTRPLSGRCRSGRRSRFSVP